MAALLGARRAALSATGVGVAAGCMGTYFEMSHGVFCIPVLTLPPMMLTQQVATGSTLFGVAARQLLSVGLYAVDPNGPTDWDNLHNAFDVTAAAALAGSGTITALGSAAVSAQLAQRGIKRLNGLILIGVACFCQWRENTVKEFGHKADTDLEELAVEMSTLVVTDEGRARVFQEEGPVMGPSMGPGGLPRTEAEVPKLQIQHESTPIGMLPRFIALGALSGVVLGFFGVGPVFMLAPLVTRTSPEWEQIAALAKDREQQSSAGSSSSWRQFMPLPLPGPRHDSSAGDDQGAAPSVSGPAPSSGADLLGPTGSDERTRRTCQIAMVPPCLAAAWRHWTFGHVADAPLVALPLAVGAVAGSAAAGTFLQDVPCDESTRFGLSILLFMYGAWTFLAPRQV